MLEGNYCIEFIRPNGYLATSQNSGGDDTLDSDADPNTGKTATFFFDPDNGDDLTHDAGFVEIPGCTGASIATAITTPACGLLGGSVDIVIQGDASAYDYRWLPNRGTPGLDMNNRTCLLYTSPSPRDATLSRMPSSA